MEMIDRILYKAITDNRLCLQCAIHNEYWVFIVESHLLGINAVVPPVIMASCCLEIYMMCDGAHYVQHDAI